MGRALAVVSIGEVLWDIIGAEKHLGGAPFNFAVHCHHLGARSGIVSRVGRDELGAEILTRARELGVDTSLIQRDTERPTGQVRVTLSTGGQPAFDICTGVDYDYLAADPVAVERVSGADVVCFGTLAQRHPVARQSIVTLLEAASLRQPFGKLRAGSFDPSAPLRAGKAQGKARGTARALLVCDLNLRPPHYSVEVVRDSLARCHLLKLNDDELHVVREMLGRDDVDDDQFLLHLLDAYGLELVCVTLGARGCILRTCQERVVAPGYPCQ
ncbi:MAG: PfkB family carbohydrate kinase, partial [Anaerolineae bacterium]